MHDASYFRSLSNPALAFAIRDIADSISHMLGYDPEAEAKYQDQLHYALAEKRKREGKDCCPTCQRPL